MASMVITLRTPSNRAAPAAQTASPDRLAGTASSLADHGRSGCAGVGGPRRGRAV